jgi:aminopeptidase N
MRNCRSFVLVLIVLFSGLLHVFGQSSSDKFNRRQTYDVSHYVVRMSFDQREKRIFGDTTVRLKPLAPGFERFELDAVGLRFESVLLEPDGSALQFKTSADKITISLPRVYSAGDHISVRLKYSASPKKGLTFTDEKKDTPAQIWTDSEPDETRYWFPSFDFPSDKATTEQHITVQKGQTVIGNGELVETRNNPDTTVTWHYRMAQPHSTYLTSFVVGRYASRTEHHGNIPLTYYVYPGRESMISPVFGKTNEMMRVFEDLTGVPYPFGKYDQIIIANFKDAGMENITATILSETEISFLLFKQPLLDDLIAHELAHSWFGNLVTCGNWAELWLNEGLATFMEAAYREKKYGRDDYLAKVRNDALEFMVDHNSFGAKQALYNQKADDVGEVFDNSSITYNKGGAVVHMLRETLGEEAFWKGINLYLTRHKYGNVDSSDLKKAMEESSSTDLDWFFSQWVYGGGYPKIEMEQVYDTNTKDFRITVSQVHKGDSITPAVFILPLDIEFTTEDGVRRETVRATKRTETFILKVPKMPSTIAVDKGSKIPVKNLKLKPLTVIQ